MKSSELYLTAGSLGLDLMWLMVAHDIYVQDAEESYNLLEQGSILNQGFDLLCPMTV